MKQNRLFLTVAMMLGIAMPVMTQNSHVFFLHVFTDTGYSHYDWRYEPLKTDKERGNLKGDVVKIVTVITDKSGRGYAESQTDTTYYNEKGNIAKVVKLNRSFDPKVKLRPTVIQYEYDDHGILKEYAELKETENRDGLKLQSHVHKMIRDQKGNIVKEEYRAYSKEGNGWKEFTSGDGVNWTFDYDVNGNLVSGKGWLGMALTYKNGQLTKMQEGTAKPVTYTYDATGRLTSLKYYTMDGMDEVFYCEESSTLTYNEHGDISKAVKVNWDCNSKWQRRSQNYSETYTFTYTYDDKGNWTKVVVYSQSGKDPRRISFTITRAITYGLPMSANGGRSQQVNANNNEVVYETVDQMPAFPGGVSGLVDFLSQNVHYPDLARVNNIQGRVMVKFVVEKDGLINECKIVKSVDPSLDKEALRVVKSMPKWQPGMKDGKPVRVSYTVPISFKL